MALSPSEARNYFMRLAQKARTRAYLARLDAASEPDPIIKRNLKALAAAYEEDARELEAKAKKIKPREGD